MKSFKRVNSPNVALLKSTVSGLAMVALTASFAGGAFAQEATATEPVAAANDGAAQEVVVIGQRKALKTSQQLKKDAETIVDSITATDIGAFPDKSVAEALQRVPGITVNRFLGGDTRHQTGEPSGVLVRGLTFVKPEFNGRDAFSATNSNGLSWQDVTPELMGGVDVYKNQTADLIEGGIAGTVNLRTRVPFDSKGQVMSLAGDVSYGDLTKKVDKSASFVYSNRWETGLGEFGAMFDIAGSNVNTSSDRLSIENYRRYDASVFGTPGTAYIAEGSYIAENKYTRDRTGIAAAGQWRNNNRTMLLTVQYNRSDYTSTLREHDFTQLNNGDGGEQDLRVAGYLQTNPTKLQPRPGTTFEFAPNGQLIRGTFSDFRDINWASAQPLNSNGQSIQHLCAPPFNPPGPDVADWATMTCSPERISGVVLAKSQSEVVDETIQDLSANFKWDLTDRLRVNLDVQYIDASVGRYYMLADLGSWAEFSLDTTTKDAPTIHVNDETPLNIRLSPGGLSNPNNWSLRDLMDHTEDGKGTQFATRADFVYDFGTTWLDSIKGGIRYVDREQQTYSSLYNWANVNNTWDSNPALWNLDHPMYAGTYTMENIGNNVYGGGHLTGIDKIPYLSLDIMADKERMRKDFTYDAMPTGTSLPWNSLCSGKGVRAEESIFVGGNCYEPQEFLDTAQKTTAMYLMLKFGGKDAVLFNGITLSGNVGYRLVTAETTSNGFINYPTAFTAAQLKCQTIAEYNAEHPLDPPISSVLPKTTGCYISAEDQAFSNGGSKALATTSTTRTVLPSLNLRFKLNDTWVGRFAYSKGLSNPDIGALRNYLNVGSSPIPNSTNIHLTDSNLIFDDTGIKTGDHVTAFKIQYSGGRGNPNLKPMTADSYDISLENYFADVGSFSIDIFHKRFHDYIVQGKGFLDVTNNGVTRSVLVNQPVNTDGGSLQGVELAFQRFFDFLPAPFDGLGVQGNLTYVNDAGIPNSNIKLDGNNGDGTTGSVSAGAFDPKALAGISRKSYNITGMYEKGDWAARLSYSWRSQYMMTTGNLYPIWADATGYMDGSVRYKVNDQIEIQLSGSNLLNAQTLVYEQVEDTGPNKERKLMPTGFNQNDRRVQLGVRYKY